VQGARSAIDRIENDRSLLTNMAEYVRLNLKNIGETFSRAGEMGKGVGYGAGCSGNLFAYFPKVLSTIVKYVQRPLKGKTLYIHPDHFSL